MAEEEKKVGTSEGKVEVPVSPEPAVDPTRFVKIEDFRTFQGKKDREVQEALRRGQEEGYARGRKEAEEELVQALDDKPEVKSVVAEHRDKTELAWLRRQRQEGEQLTQARAQYAQLFDVDAAALADAKSPFEAFQLARRANDEALLARMRGASGEAPKEKKEPPVVPIASGPSPDSGSVAETDWQRKEREIEAKIANVQTPKRERAALRRQWLVNRLASGSKGSARPRV